MASFNGYIFNKLPAIALLFLLINPGIADCQQGILDSTFTFRAGTVKTSFALDLISRHTGYNFTYDSRLIDTEKKTDMTFIDTRLGVILDSILMNDSLSFSVIDKYIIISHPEKPPSHPVDTIPLAEINYITGKIVDDETLEPLPFATIALKNTGRGTVTNNNGEFGLKISSDLVNDTLSVSYLGYMRREMPVNQAFGNNLAISMKREFISIPEIIIRNQIPQEIISRARLAIPQKLWQYSCFHDRFLQGRRFEKI